MPRKKSNTTVVREYIRGLIVKQGLTAGDMLPCEGDIATTLEISKSCVREATRALESIGLIEIRHGIGLVLRDFNLDAIGDIFDYGFALDPTIVIDLYDLRRQLETSLMPRIIANVDEDSLKRCDEILEEWAKLVEKSQPAYEVDRLFHETLYSAIDNRMLTSLCHIFWNSFRDLENNALLKRENPSDMAGARKTVEDHQRILDAVRVQDAALAQQLMFDHFGKIDYEPGRMVK